MKSNSITCNECGREYEKIIPPCNKCGFNRRDITIKFVDHVGVKDSFRLRSKISGFKKFAIEVIGGWFPSGDPNIKEGVIQERLIDKKHNLYKHKVIEYKTRKILHEEEESLTDHQKIK